MPEAVYNFYVDDSGTKEYAADRIYTLNGGKSPYFVFGGLLVTQATGQMLTGEMLRLKRECFGTHEVEIKSNWLRIPRERERRYLTRFHISSERLTQYTDDVYHLLAISDCTLIGCVVNKEETQRRYHPNVHYAPSIAYDCLLQRAQFEMMDRGGNCHVTIDDMSGATPLGSPYRQNLERQHRRLMTYGSSLQPGFHFDRIGNQSFRDSESDERLQLADLVAYCAYRQFGANGNAWDMDAALLPTYGYYGRIQSRFRHSDMGIVQGFGVVKFPLPTSVGA